MPRKPGHVPAYSHHRSSGQAIVRISGRDPYLGPHDSPESREKYDRSIAEWLSNGRQPIITAAPLEESLLVNELLLKFVDHAERYYLVDGAPLKEVVNLKLAIRPVKESMAASRPLTSAPMRSRPFASTWSMFKSSAERKSTSGSVASSECSAGEFPRN